MQSQVANCEVVLPALLIANEFFEFQRKNFEGYFFHHIEGVCITNILVVIDNTPQI